jgi:hypothetical protein
MCLDDCVVCVSSESFCSTQLLSNVIDQKVTWIKSEMDTKKVYLAL